MLFPKPPPPPTVSYGRLPALDFPKKDNLPKLEYTVETASGELPKVPNQAKVYFMPKFASTFNSLDDTRQKAATLGYPVELEKVNDTLYKFSDKGSIGKLDINTVSKAFTISYDLSADPSPLSARPPAPEVALSAAKSLLDAADLMPVDLTGPTTNAFLKVEAGKLAPAISLSEAVFIKVNLFRKNYDEIPSVTSNPDEANVWFMVGGGNKMIAAQYRYFPVDEEQFSTYPIKTPQEAVNELIGGGGFVAKLGLNETGKVTIRKIYLGYYDSGKEQGFYEPVYILEGDRGFIAYVPAVTSDYYGQK